MTLLKLITVFVCFAIAAKEIVAAAPRIVGGMDAPEGKYPYQVSLRYSGSHFCGGSIINKRWILTAAHCLLGATTSKIKVVAGTNSLQSGKNDQVHQAEYIVPHKKFTFANKTDDIGLIRLTRDIKFNSRVKPIKLPTENLIQVNATVVLSGWGRLQTNGKVPDQMQCIELLTIDQETCNRRMEGEIVASHICTFTKAGEGACNGDSGSALVANGTQVGIVSFGQPCAKGYPDVFTRVFSFLDWIRDEMAKF